MLFLRDHFMFFIPGVVVGGGGVAVAGGGVPEKNCRRKISKFDAFAESSVKRKLYKKRVQIIGILYSIVCIFSKGRVPRMS